MGQKLYMSNHNIGAQRRRCIMGELMEEHRGHCARCGKFVLPVWVARQLGFKIFDYSIMSPRKQFWGIATIEHIVEFHKVQRNERTNLTLFCKSCNHRKKHGYRSQEKRSQE